MELDYFYSEMFIKPWKRSRQVKRHVFPKLIITLMWCIYMNGSAYGTTTGQTTMPWLVPHDTTVPIQRLTTKTMSTTQNYLQGWAPGPLGLAISPNGETAYISFSLDDALLVVDLTTFTIVSSIDVSAAGIQLDSGPALLTLDGRKLYVSNYATKNVIVVDTYARQVTKVLPIPPLSAVASTSSSDGSKIYIPSFDGSLYIVSTADDSYQRIYIPRICFGPIAASRINPKLLYTTGTIINQKQLQSCFFTFDVSSQTVQRSFSLPSEVIQNPTLARRLVLNSDETIAYFGWCQLGSIDKGIGNLVAFDITNFQVAASTPADYGVADFAVNEALGKIYVLGFWSGGGSSSKVPILEWDMSIKKFVRNIPMSHSSDQRAIAVDPTNSDFLYETDGDHNILRKIQISTTQEVSRIKFNNHTIQPYAIIRGDSIGYIVSQASQDIYKLHLGSGQLIGRITVPVPFNGWGFYQGKLYVSSGSDILAIDLSNGSVVQRYAIGWNINPLIFTFFGDRMAAIDYQDGGMTAKQLVIFDAQTMALLKSIPLPNEPHGDKVVASPDGNKFYITRGQMSGTTTITVFSSITFEPINIIEILPENQRRGATGFPEGEFDEANRILYLLGFSSVYKIDMDTDRLLGTLDLIDIFDVWGRRGWTTTGLRGVSLSRSKDKLFIVAGDSHSLYTYDIVNSSWMTKITNLEGYFITDGVASLDRRYFYTANSRTDNVTMIDLTSGDMVRVIDLHSYSSTGVEDNREVHREFNLSQNYPNPFNPTTVINFSIPKSSFVTIKIFDVLGREVTTLVNEEKSTGNYSVIFDGINLSSGIYFYQIKSMNYIETKKMILLR